MILHVITLDDQVVIGGEKVASSLQSIMFLQVATDEHSDAPILNFELVPSDFDEDTLEVCALGHVNKLRKLY